MTARRTVAACIVAICMILATLLAASLTQVTTAQAATDTVLYGAGAYTGSNPIGGGSRYVSDHGYSEASADYVVTSVSELSTALDAANSGDLIWIPDGTTITISTAYGKTIKSGVALASNRGQGGAAGGKILWTYKAGDSMTALLYCQSNCVVSGLTIEGPTGYASTYGTPGGGNIALRGQRGAVRIEVENCEISKCAWGAIYFYGGGMAWNDDSSSGRHWVHHCYIHNCQRHGYGYGISEEGGCSFLAECNIFTDNRHHIMGQASMVGGTPNNYELRYNRFNDIRYGYLGNPSNLYANQQVDCHGSDSGSSAYNAGGTLKIHHNTFTNNLSAGRGNYQNVRIRGVPKTICEVYNNWTQKTTHTGLYTETSNSNGTFEQTISGSSFKNMSVHDNWYGTTAPSGSANDDSGDNGADGTSTNHPPVLSAIGNKSAFAGTIISFTVSAADADGDSLTYSASNLPSGATFSATTQAFSWTPQSSQGGVYSNVRFEVSDGKLTDSEDIAITVSVPSANSATAPALISPADGATVSGTSVTFRWNAVSGATKYFLVVSTNPDLDVAQSTSSVRKVWRELSNVTQYTVTGFANNGATYYWWVYAGTSSGWSTEADVVANGGWQFTNAQQMMTHTAIG